MQGSFVSYLDYLWRDMQMRRAMNIKYGSVYRVAVLNELGDRLAWHAPPLGAPQARQGRWGRGGGRGGESGASG